MKKKKRLETAVEAAMRGGNDVAMSYIIAQRVCS